ncbi:MAG: Trm112 family protein [Acidimicrobiia bacterium]|nr:Trm112 family protein [Acidimicrobiia bacterium]
MGLIDERLAAILVCTDCHGDLTEDLEASTLVCTKCGLRYAVVDGIANMILADATRS